MARDIVANNLRERAAWKWIAMGIVLVATIGFDFALARDSETANINWLTISKATLALGLIVWCLLRIQRWWASINRYSAPWLLLVFWLVVTAVYSISPAITAVTALTLLAMLMFQLYVVQELETPQLVWTMLLSLSGFLAVSLVLYFVAPDLARTTAWNFVEQQTQDSGRLQGLTGGPNNLGKMAAFSLVLLGVFYRDLRQANYNRIILIGMGLLAALDLVLSGSRTSILALVIAGGVVAMIRFPKLIAPVLVVGALGLLILIPNFAGIATKLSRSGNPNEIMTATGRTYVWAIAWHFIQLKPLLGYGYRTTIYLMPTYAKSIGMYYAPPTPHNAILTLWFDAGIPAVLMFISAVGSTIYYCIANRYWKILTIFMYWFCTTFTEPGGFSGVADNASLSLFLPIALLAVQPTLKVAEASRTRRRRRRVVSDSVRELA